MKNICSFAPLIMSLVLLASCSGGSESAAPDTESATNTGVGVSSTGTGLGGEKNTNQNDAGGALTCGGETDSDNPFPCCNNEQNIWQSDSTVGNCTWYAWRAAKLRMGIKLPFRGNASGWLAEANTYIANNPNADFAVTTTPMPNSIAASTRKGHVAYVISVNADGTLNLQDQACWKPGWGTTNVPVTSSRAKASYYDGYIVKRDPTCIGATGGVFSIGQTEIISCPSGSIGQQQRTCQVGGVWSAPTGICTPSAKSCIGFDGTTVFNPGQTEIFPCPSGESGSRSRTCQASGDWGPLSGSCSAALQPPELYGIVYGCSSQNALAGVEIYFTNTPSPGITYQAMINSLNQGSFFNCTNGSLGEAYSRCVLGEMPANVQGRSLLVTYRSHTNNAVSTSLQQSVSFPASCSTTTLFGRGRAPGWQ